MNVQQLENELWEAADQLRDTHDERVELNDKAVELVGRIASKLEVLLR